MTLERNSIAIQTGANDIRFASEWLDRFCRQRDVPFEQIQRLDLCLNEVLANIAAHGGVSSQDTPVRLSMAVTGHNELTTAILMVTDSGKPFNPLNAVSRPPAQSLAESTPGGLGLTMIRANSDGLDYDHLDGKNCLTISVQWARSAR